MTTSAFAINLNDRAQTADSLRGHVEALRNMRRDGASMKDCAAVFGKSYEWTRRVLKNLEYEYDYYGAGNIAVNEDDTPVEVSVVPAS